MTATAAPHTFADNWSFQAGYYSQIKEIIKQNAGSFISIEVADQETDMKKATDFVVRVTGGDIAVRIRRAAVRYRDLTIRSFNGGNRTELHKIRDGFGRFYLYGWTNENEAISEWALIDINKIRSLGILDNRREIANKDGKTRFIAISIGELVNKGCVVSRGNYAGT